MTYYYIVIMHYEERYRSLFAFSSSMNVYDTCDGTFQKERLYNIPIEHCYVYDSVFHEGKFIPFSPNDDRIIMEKNKNEFLKKLTKHLLKGGYENVR